MALSRPSSSSQLVQAHGGPTSLTSQRSHYNHVKERYGEDLCDLEVLEKIDEEWCINNNAYVKLINSDGSWAVSRHPLNQRGDESSIEKRKKSVEEIGISKDHRGGPWLVLYDKSGKDIYLAVHWATLIQGAERAYKSDTQKKNKCVQMSVIAGLSKCKIYGSNTPDDVIRWLVEWGNLLNDEATSTTILEKWRSTALIEPQWFNKRKDMNWTTNSLPQKVRDDKKFAFVNSIHKNRWSCYHTYEISNTFYKEAMKAQFVKDGATVTVWSELEALVQARVDLTRFNITMDEKIQQVAADAMRVLKSHPEWVVPVISLCMPSLQSEVAGQPRGPGKCLWLPKGLPLLAPPSVAKLDTLLSPMAGAKVVAAGSPANVLKPKAKAKGKVKKQSVDRDAFDDGDEKSSPTDSYLDHLNRTFAYLSKFDLSHSSESLGEFKAVVLHATLADGVDLKVGSSQKKIDSWNLLRQMIKAEVYRIVSLRPRPTDEDFAALTDPKAENEESQGSVSSSVEPDIVAMIEDLGPFADELRKHLVSEGKLTSCVWSQLSATAAVNSTMMAMFSHIGKAGGKLDSVVQAVELLASAACDETLKLLPAAWDAVGVLVQDIIKNPSALGQCQSDFKQAFADLVAQQVNVPTLFALRMSLWAHIMSNLGLQNVAVSKGSSMEMSCYLSRRAHQRVADMLKQYNVMENRACLPSDMLALLTSNAWSFEDVVLKYIARLVEWCDQVDNGAGDDYATKRVALEQLVLRSTSEACKKGLPGFFTNPIITAKIPKNFDVFPDSRNKFAAQVLELFDKERATDKNLKELADSMHDRVVASLRLVAVVQETSLALSAIGEPSSLGDTAGNDGNVGAGASLLTNFGMRVAETEVKNVGYDAVFKRRVIAAVTLKVTELFAEAPYGLISSCNLAVEKTETGKLIVVRLGEEAAKQDDRFRLPFFGRVVEEPAAAMASRMYVLPLGNAAGNGPPLYLDGTSFVNTEKADVSFAFLMNREKARLPDDGEPAKKKGKTQRERPTHKVIFEDFELEVGTKKLQYQMPYLVAIDEANHIEGKCIREFDMAWEEAVLAKPDKATTTKSSVGFIYK